MGADLETRIAGDWFNHIGAVAIVIAAGLLLKFASRACWIGPLAICAGGWLAGLGLLAGGERFRSRMPLYGQVLAGAGAALLYVTTYGGYVRSESPPARSPRRC